MDYVFSAGSNVKAKDLTRRQLLRTLSAVAAACALPLKTKASPVFKPIWLNQFTYTAKDMRMTADWYAHVFGMQKDVVSSSETHLWFGDAQGDTLMIVRQAKSGEMAPAITRFGFTINYWNSKVVKAELQLRGLDPKADTDKGFWFNDPEGNEIGVFAQDWRQRPSRKPSEQVILEALSVNHVVLVSSDYKKLSNWYNDLIAFNQTTDSGKDVVQWFGDSVWLPTQVRKDKKTSAALKSFDHCALTVKDFDTRIVVNEMVRHGIIPESLNIREDDTGIYGRDINDFMIQVCSWSEAPNQDRRRMQRGPNPRPA